MFFGTTSRAKLRSAVEATFGSVTAATARRSLRFLGESFQPGIQFESSKEIRNDRQTADHIPVGDSAQGGFNFELSYNEYDTYLEDALFNTWNEIAAGGVTAALTSPVYTANTLTKTGGASLANLAKGQWVKISGGTGGSAANNIVAQVSLTVAPTADTIAFEGTPFSFTGSATGSVVVSSARLSNGVIQRSRAFEIEYSDITQFTAFLGQTCSKLSLTINSKSRIEGTFSYMGSAGLAATGASSLPGADNVNFPTAFEIMNSSSSVANILEGGSALTGTRVKSLSLEIDNSLRMQDAIAQRGAAGIGNGSVKITGKMTVYFADGVLYNKFMNSTNSSLSFRTVDSSGNGYVWTLPAVKYTNGGAPVSALDQDVMVELEVSAKVDPLSGKMLVIDRFGVAVLT